MTDSSRDELGQLTQHYNSMAHRIRNQFAQIQQFENKRKDGHYLGIGLTANEETVNIVVRDKGRGIPAEHQAQVFERFYRAIRIKLPR